MGNFEKLVVLIVLFLSLVAVAVSSGDSEEPGTGPTALEERSAPSEPVQRPATKTTRPTSKPASTKPAASLLLDATPKEAPRKQVAKPTAKPVDDGRILVTTVGLEPSLIDEYMEYTVSEGDTWVGLAKTFYQDARRATDLRVANDDPQSLRPGMSILVPVYDLSKEAGTRDSYAPRGEERVATKAPAPARSEGFAGRPSPSTTKPNAVAQATDAVAPQAGTSYTVKDGDNLSKISKTVYGTATRWQEIYEANKDVMKSADWLRVGMKLTIPEAGTIVVPKEASAPTAATTNDTKKPDPNKPRVR